MILDASALLALLRVERGAAMVAGALGDQAISSVNFAEVLSKVGDLGGDIALVCSQIAQIGVTVIPFDSDTALIAAELRAATRHAGLSFGDRACLATARKLGLPVMTADRDWSALDLGVEILLIR